MSCNHNFLSNIIFLKRLSASKYFLCRVFSSCKYLTHVQYNFPSRILIRRFIICGVFSRSKHYSYYFFILQSCPFPTPSVFTFRICYLVYFHENYFGNNVFQYIFILNPSLLSHVIFFSHLEYSFLINLSHFK